MQSSTPTRISALGEILQSLEHDKPDKGTLACAILASALDNAKSVLAQHHPTLTPEDTIDTMGGITPNDHARLKALTSKGCAFRTIEVRERDMWDLKTLRSHVTTIFMDAGVTPETAARLARELSM